MRRPLQTLLSQQQPDLARRTAVLAISAAAAASRCDARRPALVAKHHGAGRTVGAPHATTPRALVAGLLAADQASA